MLSVGTVKLNSVHVMKADKGVEIFMLSVLVGDQLSA
jgi:hypothetical protein